MTPGESFYCISSQGAYNMSNIVTSTGNSNIGLLSGLIDGGTANQAAVLSYQYIVQEPVKQVKKKLKGLLMNLRSEVDGWHGDILERCPA